MDYISSFKRLIQSDKRIVTSVSIGGVEVPFIQHKNGYITFDTGGRPVNQFEVNTVANSTAVSQVEPRKHTPKEDNK